MKRVQVASLRVPSLFANRMPVPSDLRRERRPGRRVAAITSPRTLVVAAGNAALRDFRSTVAWHRANPHEPSCIGETPQLDVAQVRDAVPCRWRNDVTET